MLVQNVRSSTGLLIHLIFFGHSIKVGPPPKRTRLAMLRSAAASSATEGSSNATLSASTISRLAAALGADCARLVPHMGLSDDELQYVQSKSNASANRGQQRHNVEL